MVELGVFFELKSTCVKAKEIYCVETFNLLILIKICLNPSNWNRETKKQSYIPKIHRPLNTIRSNNIDSQQQIL